MKVKSTLLIYEVNDKDVPPGERDGGLAVESHWNRSGLVVLNMPGWGRITVDAAELRAAVINATNTR